MLAEHIRPVAHPRAPRPRRDGEASAGFDEPCFGVAQLIANRLLGGDALGARLIDFGLSGRKNRDRYGQSDAGEIGVSFASIGGADGRIGNARFFRKTDFGRQRVGARFRRAQFRQAADQRHIERRRRRRRVRKNRPGRHDFAHKRRQSLSRFGELAPGGRLLGDRLGKAQLRSKTLRFRQITGFRAAVSNRRKLARDVGALGRQIGKAFPRLVIRQRGQEIGEKRTLFRFKRKDCGVDGAARALRPSGALIGDVEGFRKADRTTVIRIVFAVRELALEFRIVERPRIGAPARFSRI